MSTVDGLIKQHSELRKNKQFIAFQSYALFSVLAVHLFILVYQFNSKGLYLFLLSISSLGIIALNSLLVTRILNSKQYISSLNLNDEQHDELELYVTGINPYLKRAGYFLVAIAIGVLIVKLGGI